MAFVSTHPGLEFLCCLKSLPGTDPAPRDQVSSLCLEISICGFIFSLMFLGIMLLWGLSPCLFSFSVDFSLLENMSVQEYQIHFTGTLKVNTRAAFWYLQINMWVSSSSVGVGYWSLLHRETIWIKIWISSSKDIIMTSGLAFIICQIWTTIW